MALIKRGKCDQGKVKLTSCLYKCPSCGHVDTGKEGGTNTCPKCKTPMTLMSCSVDEQADKQD
jgi:rubrerythrin